MFTTQSLALKTEVEQKFNLPCTGELKTLTPSPWTTPMDYPNGLPKWTTLKQTEGIPEKGTYEILKLELTDVLPSRIFDRQERMPCLVGCSVLPVW